MYGNLTIIFSNTNVLKRKTEITLEDKDEEDLPTRKSRLIY